MASLSRYWAAVSIRLMPRSSALRTTAAAAASGTPLLCPSWLGPPVPSPSTETCRPVRPNRRYSISPAS